MSLETVLGENFKNSWDARRQNAEQAVYMAVYQKLTLVIVGYYYIYVYYNTQMLCLFINIRQEVNTKAK